MIIKVLQIIKGTDYTANIWVYTLIIQIVYGTDI